MRCVCVCLPVEKLKGEFAVGSFLQCTSLARRFHHRIYFFCRLTGVCSSLVLSVYKNRCLCLGSNTFLFSSMHCVGRFYVDWLPRKIKLSLIVRHVRRRSWMTRIRSCRHMWQFEFSIFFDAQSPSNARFAEFGEEGGFSLQTNNIWCVVYATLL